MEIFTGQVLRYLMPNAEFKISGGDLSTLEILNNVDVKIPTQKEFDDAKQLLLEKQKDELAQQIAKRNAAEAKLAALGLTPEDLKALGLA